jgi:hypothetical protein
MPKINDNGDILDLQCMISNQRKCTGCDVYVKDITNL